MKLWWYAAGNIVYGIGSFGYTVVNIVNLIDRRTINSSITYAFLIFLAALFVIDALLYTADWLEQRSRKTRRELIGCLLNVTGSVLYLLGATVFKGKSTSVVDLSDIPTFVFNIIGMLAYLAESILCFFMPRVSKQTSKCSIEFFAHLLNFIGNLSYVIAHIVQPTLAFLASFTTQLLNRVTDLLYFIIRPIQIFGDVIYMIDAILYILVWLKANEQMRKVGTTWAKRSHAVVKRIVNVPSVVHVSAISPIETKSNAISFITRIKPSEDASPRIPDTILEDTETMGD
jgi:hypothetical protein